MWGRHPASWLCPLGRFDTYITDAELGLTGYVMFRRDRIGRRGGEVILYVKESIQAYEIKLEKKAD